MQILLLLLFRLKYQIYQVRQEVKIHIFDPCLHNVEEFQNLAGQLAKQDGHFITHAAKV